MAAPGATVDDVGVDGGARGLRAGGPPQPRSFGVGKGFAAYLVLLALRR